MSDKLPTRERRLSKIGTAILLVASILSGTVLRAQAEDAAKRPSISEHEFPSEVRCVSIQLPPDLRGGLRFMSGVFGRDNY